MNSLTETALHKVGGPQNALWFWAFSWRLVSTIFRSGGILLIMLPRCRHSLREVEAWRWPSTCWTKGRVSVLGFLNLNTPTFIFENLLDSPRYQFIALLLKSFDLIGQNCRKNQNTYERTDKLFRTEWGDTAAHYAARHGAVCMLK